MKRHPAYPIVLAAIKDKKTNKVWVGPRHYLLRERLKHMFKINIIKSPGRYISGFLDMNGKFLNRSKAAEVAFREGQIDKEKSILTTEDLW